MLVAQIITFCLFSKCTFMNLNVYVVFKEILIKCIKIIFTELLKLKTIIVSENIMFLMFY